MKRIFLLLSCSILTLSLFSEEPFRGKILTEKLQSSDFKSLKEGECRIIVLRHGQTDWNAAGKGQGWTDIPLNENGREEARVLAGIFEDLQIKYVYTSALSRALETAQIIATPHNALVTADPTLRFYKQDKKFFDFLLTKSMKKNRLKEEIQTDSVAYLKNLAKRYPGQTIVVVTHGRVLKNLYCVLAKSLSGKIAIKNGASACIIATPDSLTLEAD